MTQARIKYKGKEYLISERDVVRSDGVQDENAEQLFEWVERYHFRHTSIVDAIYGMITGEGAKIEILEDFGGVPDRSLDEDD